LGSFIFVSVSAYRTASSMAVRSYSEPYPRVARCFGDTVLIKFISPFVNSYVNYDPKYHSPAGNSQLTAVLTGGEKENQKRFTIGDASGGTGSTGKITSGSRLFFSTVINGVTWYLCVPGSVVGRGVAGKEVTLVNYRANGTTFILTYKDSTARCHLEAPGSGVLRGKTTEYSDRPCYSVSAIADSPREVYDDIVLVSP